MPLGRNNWIEVRGNRPLTADEWGVVLDITIALKPVLMKPVADDEFVDGGGI